MLRKIYCLLLLFFFACSYSLIGQEIVIQADKKPLNEVLIGIRDQYQVAISFDNNLLSNFKVSSDTSFNSPEIAIISLIKGLPLKVENNNSVFIIYPCPVTEKKQRIYSLSGMVLESGTNEPLPYSHLLISGRGTITDQAGSFTYSTAEDSIFSVRISHLAYYIVDTTLPASHDLQLFLVPSVIGLTEIEIKNKSPETATQIGEQAGLMKLNNKIAFFLPGYGDNSVLNLLRLMPGILASGEQTNELIIWGSYAGQSKVDFDGFTVWGLKNFNDNISSFNPLVSKNMEVFKGGYDARYGDRVGGIVNITGKNGNMQRPSFLFNINNMTISGLAEIPLFKTSSLLIAFRHTYYNLYNSEDMSSVLYRNNDNDTTNDVDVNVVPDYLFRDINLKYSSIVNKKDLFYISLYAGNDKFNYSFEEPVNNVILQKETNEINTQIGGSAFYGKTWKNGYISNFLTSYSELESDFSDDFYIEFPRINFIKHRIDENSTNIISEATIENDNIFALNQTHRLEFGTGLKYNHVKLSEDTFNVESVNITQTGERLFFFLQDNMALGKRINFKIGTRVNYAFNLQKTFFEPRASISIDLGKYWKINAAWGIYNQFITKSSVVDENNNFRYIWTICDNSEIPVLSADHYVLGTAFHFRKFIFSLEGYFKSTDGLTRFIYSKKMNLREIFIGQSRTYGADLMIKKDFGKHSAWISYTLCRTEELFDYFQSDEYRRAPQDQLHEIKLALLLNFDPFFFSSDYVYGSGFPYATEQQLADQTDLTYSRWDASFIYKFLDRKVKAEIGLSVLNLLNTQNIKYETFEQIPANQVNAVNIYSEAIPITPTLYLKITY